MGNSAATFREFAQQVRAAADIVEIVQQYVELKRAGANLRGLCPFHQEKTPSFHVHPGKQIFKCFGCGKSGDVLTFTQEIERADFRQALEILAGKYGLTVPRFSAQGPEEEKVRHRQTMAAALEEAARYYSRRLAHESHGADARAYLERRGVSPEMIEKFRLGVAGEDWAGLCDHLSKKGYSAQCLRDTGIGRDRKEGSGVFDYLRGRLIFPIANSRGEIIGFGGRAFGDELPKYLNTAETEFFRKGTELYGLFAARDTMTRQEKPAILVEGYMDVIACHQAGLTSAVASMGTALTPEQARLLRRYTKEVVFLYDGDEAGIKAILRGLEVLIAAGLLVRVGRLAGGEDPDSLLRHSGSKALEQVVAQAIPYFDFLLEQARMRYDMTTPEGKLQSLALFEPVFAAIPEELVYSDYVGRLATLMGHEEGALNRYLRKQARPARRRRLAPAIGRPSEGSASAAPSPDTHESTSIPFAAAAQAPRHELGLLQILIEHSEARMVVRGRLNPDWIEHPQVRHWTARILELGEDVYDVWPALQAQCESPDQEAFLQSAIFLSGEPMDDYLAVVEHLLSRIAADFRRRANLRLHLAIQEMGCKERPQEAVRMVREQIAGLKSRNQERQKAVSNPCVRVKH